MAIKKKHVNFTWQIFVLQIQLNALEFIGLKHCLTSHTTVEKDNKSSKYTILLSNAKTNEISLRVLTNKLYILFIDFARQ